MFEALAADAQVVIDIGGGIGIYAIAASMVIQDDGLIICFEPDAGNYELAAENLVLNDALRVILSSEGIGEKTNSGTLYRRSRNSGGASLTPTPDESVKGQPILITTLDAFCSGRGITDVDLIKIDIEGYELDALRGAQEILKKLPSILPRIQR